MTEVHMALAITFLVFFSALMAWSFRMELQLFIDMVRFDFTGEVRRRIELLKMDVAYLMPRWLVYHCAVRLFAHGTIGKWGNTEVSEVRAMTVLKRWGEK